MKKLNEQIETRNCVEKLNEKLKRELKLRNSHEKLHQEINSYNKKKISVQFCPLYTSAKPLNSFIPWIAENGLTYTILGSTADSKPTILNIADC